MYGTATDNKLYSINTKIVNKLVTRDRRLGYKDTQRDKDTHRQGKGRKTETEGERRQRETERERQRQRQRKTHRERDRHRQRYIYKNSLIIERLLIKDRNTEELMDRKTFR